MSHAVTLQANTIGFLNTSRLTLSRLCHHHPLTIGKWVCMGQIIGAYAWASKYFSDVFRGCNDTPLLNTAQVGLDEAAAMERLAGAIPNMLQWMRTFVADQLQPGSLVDMGYSSTGPAAQRMCIQVGPRTYGTSSKLFRNLSGQFPFGSSAE